MQRKYPSVSLLKELTNAYNVVVQKGNVTESNIYALQLRNGQTNTYVTRGSRSTGYLNKSPKVVLYGSDGYNAGGHTQTWEYANKSGSWLVGTKKDVNGWTKQIARVQFPKTGTVSHYYNTEMPRLSYLNRAGQEFGIAYAGADMKRVEAAVSPSYNDLLIASVDNSGNGYFSIYNLKEVNKALDSVEGTGKDVPITNLSCRTAFKITNLVGTLGELQNDPKRTGSIQGYDIDDERNIFISSQKSPDNVNDVNKKRKIIRIPWGATDTDKWQYASLDDEYLDVSGHISEFESVQVIDSKTLYLTVSYHDKNNGLTSNRHRIFKVTWN
ncbi:helveticin J family class III bacteriocin [Lactobacillus apis]|uniref:helveticin J family class III bacteriocin n=1 Tax=Lactobacillus apis TaxID=303541 RepID=UPI00242DC357|nr:helveticin J family class III bacteriocin [Lactobacillus apis]